MKKNLVFKLGLFCAALVLIATCFVSSAWAKYTSTVSATDTARVAKWEVSMVAGADEVMNSTKLTLFDTTFKNIKKETINTDGTTKLIAPGSTGQFSFVVNSSSQVSVQFDFDADVTNANNIPLKWTVKLGDEVVYSNGDDLETGIKNANVLYKANTTDDDITGYKTVTGAQTITIIWNWAYEVDDAGNTADTGLGTAGSATCTVKLSMTATQVAPKN